MQLEQGGNVLLKDKVQSLLHQGYKNLLLDLSGVSHVDSAGLGEMVQAYVTTKNRGASLRLLNVTKRLRDLLVVTKLLTVGSILFSTQRLGLVGQRRWMNHTTGSWRRNP